MSTLLDRIADAGGVLYFLLVFTGFAFLVAPHMPGSLDSPDAVLAHLQAHPPTAAFWAGIWLEGAGLAALVLLVARIASRIRAAQPDWWLPAAAVGLAVAAFTVKVGSFTPGLAALGLERLDATVVTALLSINDAAVPVTGALDGAFVLLLGLGAVVTATLPRWLSWFTVAAGLAMLAAPALDSLQVLFYVWVLVASGWLLARGRHVGVRSAEPLGAGT